MERITNHIIENRENSILVKIMQFVTLKFWSQSRNTSLLHHSQDTWFIRAVHFTPPVFYRVCSWNRKDCIIVYVSKNNT